LAADIAVAPFSIEAQDPQAIGNLGVAAANRIALFIQEQKAARPAP
jgi:hypothetical protein